MSSIQLVQSLHTIHEKPTTEPSQDELPMLHHSLRKPLSPCQQPFHRVRGALLHHFTIPHRVHPVRARSTVVGAELEKCVVIGNCTFQGPRIVCHDQVSDEAERVVQRPKFNAGDMILNRTYLLHLEAQEYSRLTRCTYCSMWDTKGSLLIY